MYQQQQKILAIDVSSATSIHVTSLLAPVVVSFVSIAIKDNEFITTGEVEGDALHNVVVIVTENITSSATETADVT